MNNIFDRFQEAENLFNQKDYLAANEICLELLNTIHNNEDATPELHIKVNVLAAKIVLFLSTPLNLEENKKAIFLSIRNTAHSITHIKEFFQIKFKIFEAINDWERYWFNKNLDYIKDNPTNANWRKYYIDNIIPFALLFSESYDALFEELDKICNTDDLCEEEDLEESVNIVEKYGIPLTNEFTCIEQNAKIYEVGCSIFDNIVSFIEANKHSSNEYLSSLGGKMIDELLLAKIIIQQCTIPDENGENNPEEPNLLTYLHKEAEILRYISTVNTYPNGIPVKLFGNTTDEEQELRIAYQRIKELDESFVIPEIPVSKSTTVTTTKSSGGCYVATAVYGSYDCPEVWTLRRYRDDNLANTFKGRLFIKLYYAISPTLVKYFGNTNWFKKMWKAPLDRMVAHLQSEGVEATPYNDKQW